MSSSSESPVIAEAPETAPHGRDGAVVVLWSVGWKNPFLWLILGMGIPITIIAAVEFEGENDPVVLMVAVATVVLAVLAHFALRARLEIRPDGFRAGPT